MKTQIALGVLCMCATASFGQTQPAICPKHMETPEYPLLARQTRLMGEVRLLVTIDAQGKAQHVAAMPGRRPFLISEKRRRLPPSIQVTEEALRNMSWGSPPRTGTVQTSQDRRRCKRCGCRPEKRPGTFSGSCRG